MTRNNTALQENILLLYASLYRQANRCAMYALRADRDGRPELAVYFKALSESHTRQANRFLLQARGVTGSTEENARIVLDNEIPAFLETYAALDNKAQTVENKALATGCRQSSSVERMNANLLKRLMDNPQVRSYHICRFCGFISVDDPPESCPVCTAQKKRFTAITP